MHRLFKNKDLKINFLLFLCLVMPLNAQAIETGGAGLIKVEDDAGRLLELSQAAQRVISLSPHITELVYAVGGAEKIIAGVDFSNFPEQAKALPRVGSGYQLDIESIVSLKPDLIIAWRSGNSRAQLEKLEKLGFTVYYSEPKTLADIAENIRDIGKLLGEQLQANQQADEFMQGIERLKQKNKHNKKVTVFYQVWHQPLFTINRKHIISHVIELCGGINIFSELNTISPQVSIESVISRNPEVIVAGIGDGRNEWLPAWNKWPLIKAVKNKQVYGIDADLIVRHTPRILQGAELMCEYLQQVRNINSNKSSDHD